MLEYDNSAFYYFALTLLAIYILPATWYAVSELIFAFFWVGDANTKARSSQEKEKALKLKEQTSGWARLNKIPYLINLCFLVLACIVFFYLINKVSSDGQVSSFDPYTILGIEQGTPLAEIKKAYRKLSLKYHPDKNIGDKFAEEMFMKIAKAYEALTDETSKENYEKYGNPDGKQALEVSIGLPKILLENPKIVLVLYLIAMVVVIPSVVGFWYSNSKLFGEKNIMYETYNTFFSLLQESHRVKNLPEILAASVELRTINSTITPNQQCIDLLYDKMKKDKLMIKPKLEVTKVLRGNLLLHAHMLRLTETLSPDLRKDLQDMLRRTPELLDGLIEIAQHRKWLETGIATIKLSQCLVQALWIPSEPFLQLPFLSEADIKHIKATKQNIKSISDFVRLSGSQRPDLKSIAPAEREELYAVCSVLPRISLEFKVFVEEDEEDDDDIRSSDNNISDVKGDQIYEQDLVTVRLILTREHIPEGKTTGPAYAPYFPAPVAENWWVVLTDKPENDKPTSSQTQVNIYAFEKISDQDRVVKHELRFLAPQNAGEYELQLSLFSDCYVGFDEIRTIRYEVLPAANLPEFVPHPEDVQLDNEPTLFEQMMAANVDEDSSDEEDEIDADVDTQGSKFKGSSSANLNKKGPPTRRVIDDVSDDGEDE